MRRRCSMLLLAALVALACRSEPPGEGPPPPAPAAPAAPQAPRPSQEAPAGATAFPIRVDGVRFVDGGDRPFEWRGITAFRLAEMIAGGRENDAAAYLDWATSEGLTVVRVLLTARHLFELTPADGRAALPALLDLAKARGLAVEVVALADTKDRDIDYDAHIREVGRIAAEKGNAFVEIANEPGHPTQDPRLHDPAFARRLADLVPEPVVVALGSFEYGDGYAAGDYATTHVPRGEGGWDHVFEIAGRAGRVAELKKPVVSDEPIGAGPEYQPGRRDNEPSRFAAAAALTRLAGIAATFHYDGGLHARIPKGPEAESLAAWKAGLALVAADVVGGEFVQAEEIDRVARIEGARRGYARVSAEEATILLVDPRDSPSVTWPAGWKETSREALPGVAVVKARRDPR